MQSDYAARLGIDWADQKHAWALQVADESRTEQGELEHTPEAVDQFVAGLAARFPGRKVAVALEQSRGPLFYMLSKYQHVDLYPVHPSTLDHYRQSFYPSGAKSDPRDAALILELLVKHPERLRVVVADTPEARQLGMLVEDRREAVDDKTRAGNQLRAQLKLYFPHLLAWFDVDQVVLAEMLCKWPTLEQLQRVAPARLEKFLRQRSVPESKRQRIGQELTSAVSALTDRGVIPRFCARRFTNGLGCPRAVRNGRGLTTIANGPATSPTMPQFEPWLSNGCASCSAVGSSTSRIKNLVIWSLCRNVPILWLSR